MRDFRIIIETNGTVFGRDRSLKTELADIEDLKIDIDVSFKGVNEDQFRWIADMPEEYFQLQISGFVDLFDFAEDVDNLNVNPVLGLNHSTNYCVWKNGKKYVMDVEIVDANGSKMDFYDYSKDFENEVLSRKELRYDEAPFREYSGINRDRAREVVAVLYGGKRYIGVLPSEIPDLVS